MHGAVYHDLGIFKYLNLISVKQLGCEADHSHHFVMRLRIHRAIPPLPQYIFMEWYLIK